MQLILLFPPMTDCAERTRTVTIRKRKKRKKRKEKSFALAEIGTVNQNPRKFGYVSTA